MPKAKTDATNVLGFEEAFDSVACWLLFSRGRPIQAVRQLHIEFRGSENARRWPHSRILSRWRVFPPERCGSGKCLGIPASWKPQSDRWASRGQPDGDAEERGAMPRRPAESGGG